MTGAAYDYGSESERWPGNIDGVIAATDEALYAYMAHKWPWLNDAGANAKDRATRGSSERRRREG